MDRLEAHRMFFAQLVTASVGVPATERNLIEAFASTPRERFLGDGPWQVFTRGGYIQTPSDDPALLYQDITVALRSEEQINNGQPTLHAICLAVLGVKEGENIVRCCRIDDVEWTVYPAKCAFGSAYMMQRPDFIKMVRSCIKYGDHFSIP